jgi:glutathione S-transferase
MKLHYHPVSTVCRPIMLFTAEHDIVLDYQVVDLFADEQLQEPFAAINPSTQVPVLQDGDFLLTEASAILKYLAEKVGSDEYPSDLRQRARINERMDWFNTGLYRDLGYGLVYPQILPNHRRDKDDVNASIIHWARDKSRHWLGILDRHIIGQHNTYVCGERITLADYFGAGIITLGEVIKLDYSPWPGVCRWLAALKSRRNWSRVNEAFYEHFVGPYASGSFISLDATGAA